MKSKLWRLFPLLLIALVGMLVWHNPAQQGQGGVRTLDCPDLHTGCRIDLDGKAVAVSVSGLLKPLQSFQIRVDAPKATKVEARR